VTDTIDELAVVFLENNRRLLSLIEMHRLRRTYDVANGLHILPEWTSRPPGPHPTRNERPMDKPASKYTPSLPLTIDDLISTRAYLREGRKMGGSTL